MRKARVTVDLFPTYSYSSLDFEKNRTIYSAAKENANAQQRNTANNKLKYCYCLSASVCGMNRKDRRDKGSTNTAVNYKSIKRLSTRGVRKKKLIVKYRDILRRDSCINSNTVWLNIFLFFWGGLKIKKKKYQHTKCVLLCSVCRRLLLRSNTEIPVK